jgi:hypothetical protein
MLEQSVSPIHALEAQQQQVPFAALCILRENITLSRMHMMRRTCNCCSCSNGSSPVQEKASVDLLKRRIRRQVTKGVHGRGDEGGNESVAVEEVCLVDASCISPIASYIGTALHSIALLFYAAHHQQQRQKQQQ